MNLGWGHALLFAGLWGQADRRGVLEDRPGQIRAKLPLLCGNPPFHMTQAEVDQALNDLQRAPNRFIKRYAAKGVKLIKILNFNTHQNPHIKEKASNFLDFQTQPTALGLHGANTSVAGLTPDSGLLTPDSKDVGAAPAAPPRPKLRRPGKKIERPQWQFVFGRIFDWLKERKHGADPGISGRERGHIRNIYDGYGWATVCALWDLWVEKVNASTGKENKWTEWAVKRGYCVEAFYNERGLMLDDARWKDKRDEYEKRDAKAYQPKDDEVPIGNLLTNMIGALTPVKKAR